MAVVAAPGLDQLRVGFVGAGRMAEALARGFIRAGKVEAQHILASAPSDRNLCHFRALGCQTTHSNQEVVQNCWLVFFATKPHVLPAVLAEVAPVVTTEHILVSVAAGISLSTLEELLPPATRVLRISPNLPCVVQEGAVVMARGRHTGNSDAELLETLLEACGQCEEVPEAHVDIHTGLSGSGVAFTGCFIQGERQLCQSPPLTAAGVCLLRGLGRRCHQDGHAQWPGPPHCCPDPAGHSQVVAAEGAAPGSAADRRVHAGRHHHLWAACAGAGRAAGGHHERRGGCHLPGQGAEREVGSGHWPWPPPGPPSLPLPGAAALPPGRNPQGCPIPA
ncbi:pyrroline-5-carboxylate reductase 3 isoform X1 [Leopardus geoffroyi]|uniref:pyrroline-5-carboxylate reductase 3 isoform X1 n=1 Tax=Leopardus geoffroyi TaxID=46844 RepID=UPI001E2613E2|nr:pyrroline-5-carboxylate reductase 3 isoform X1 [Leopardus geoffroyi]